MCTAPCLHHQVKGILLSKRDPSFQGYSSWILLDHLGILGRDHIPPAWSFYFGGQHQWSTSSPPYHNRIGALGGAQPGEGAEVGLLQGQGELHRPAYLRPRLNPPLPSCDLLPRRDGK